MRSNKFRMQKKVNKKRNKPSQAGEASHASDCKPRRERGNASERASKQASKQRKHTERRETNP